jgi:elongation factor G
MHIEVTVAKLKRRFGVEVNLKPPRIPYRETITAATEAHGRTRSRPADTASSATARSAWSRSRAAATSSSRTNLSAARFPRSSCPAVEKGIQDARMRGYLAGYPMVDFKATVYDGSFPSGRFERTVVQAGGVTGVQGCDDARAPHDPRADHEGRGLHAKRFRG